MKKFSFNTKAGIILVLFFSLFFWTSCKIKTQESALKVNNLIKFEKNLINDKTISDCDKLLKMNPNDSIAYANRAYLKQDVGDLKGAFEDYNKSLELENNPAVNLLRGSLKVQLGFLDEGETEIKMAINDGCKMAESYSILGLAKDAKGDYKKAIKQYDKAISLDNTINEFYQNRATSKAHLGRYKDAIKDYEKALDLSKASNYIDDFEKSLCDMSVAMIHLGYFETALDNLNKALAISPNDFVALNARGILYIKMGNKELAKKDLVNACKLGSEQACEMMKGI